MLTSLPITPFAAAAPVRNVRLHNTYRNLTLWTLQGWLAMFFIAAGYAKLTEPMSNLIVLLNWPEAASPDLVFGAGVLEIALSVGVIAPLATWRFRKVAVASATGLATLALTMLGVHFVQPDFGLALVNLILAAFALAVVAGRWSTSNH